MAAVPQAPSCPLPEEDGRLLPALCRGTVALCLLHALRLQRGWRLSEANRRQRAARHRRAQARSRQRFALLWLCRLLAREHRPSGLGPIAGWRGGATLPRLLRERRLWSKCRSSAFWEIVRVKAFSAWEWAENFRVSPGTFDYLCAHLRNAIQRRDTNMRRAIPADVRLAMTLWRLGACTEYRAVEQLFGVSRSTVCKILRDVCEAVVGILTPLYVRPPDPAQVAASNGFPLPQLAGVLGSLHVPIRAPNENAAGYYNRRGWHSVVVQAAVDSRGCFWDINVGCPGRVTDTQVLGASDLYQQAQRGELFPGGSRDVSGVQVPIYLLGGCSYPFLPWLMRPYRAAALSASQQRFNEYADAARTVLAVAFGRLRGRWRCLTKRNDTDVSFLPTLIAACCTLHNICEARGDAFQACWMEEEEDEPREEQPGEEGEEEDAEAVEIRDALASGLRGL
ncbi:protein ANTAGONIST OF LIKE HETEROCHROMATIN PROTEIN 1-like [Pseudonaja textilis]|uniref:Protein ANTAGONIST OF LIKE HETEROCHROMATIN PROTEIN 1-like n=1 Tax=Pseudonaja textilis TaxID=8673 RepID=A0A670YTR8_PSETE|nr:protein ANTAGONIST OF LIKE HETEROCHROMATIN PROTEIN 1-like [Pseudonaja textilis]